MLILEDMLSRKPLTSFPSPRGIVKSWGHLPISIAMLDRGLLEHPPRSPLQNSRLG